MFYLYKMVTYKLIGESINFSSSDSRLYKDLCAPTITVAVGLSSGVVLHPVADSAIVVSSKAALIETVFLLYLLSALESVDMSDS